MGLQMDFFSSSTSSFTPPTFGSLSGGVWGLEWWQVGVGVVACGGSYLSFSTTRFGEVPVILPIFCLIMHYVMLVFPILIVISLKFRNVMMF